MAQYSYCISTSGFMWKVRRDQEIVAYGQAPSFDEARKKAQDERDKRILVGQAFNFGHGSVSAQHPNGGGWVADTAVVSATAYIGPNAKVFGNAVVGSNARIEDTVEIGGTAKVLPNGFINGSVKIFDGVHFKREALSYDFGEGHVPAHRHHNGGGWVSDDCRIDYDAYIAQDAKVFNKSYVLGRVEDFALVKGGVIGRQSVVGGTSKILGAKVICRAKLYGNSIIEGPVVVSNNKTVYDLKISSEVKAKCYLS